MLRPKTSFDAELRTQCDLRCVICQSYQASFSLLTPSKDLSSGNVSEFNPLRWILLGGGREEIDSSAFPPLHKNSAAINSIYYTSNALKRPAPMTVGCGVRGHLSIKQLIPTPPRSASCGGVASPQVCSKRPTVHSSHIIVCLHISIVAIFAYFSICGYMWL